MDLRTRFKKFKPDKLKVYTLDGEEYEMEVPKGRNKWSIIMENLGTMAWEKIEAFHDEKLLFIEEEKTTTFDEKETDSFERVSDIKEERLLAILTKAQKMVLNSQRENVEVLVRGYQDLIELVVDRVAFLERHYMDTLELLREAAQAQAEKSDSEDTAQLNNLAQTVVALAADKMIK